MTQRYARNYHNTKEMIMLQFQELTAAHGDRLRGYYRNCDYRLCEYSLGVKLMWRDHLHPSFAEVAGCLVIRNCICLLYTSPSPRDRG